MTNSHSISISISFVVISSLLLLLYAYRFLAAHLVLFILDHRRVQADTIPGFSKCPYIIIAYNLAFDPTVSR